MEFSKSITEIIQERTSCRTYSPDQLDPASLAAIQSLCSSSVKVPWDSAVRFQLQAATDEDSRSLKGLGTYGIIKDPAGYIIGAVGPGEGNLEDYGYAMEYLILHATDRGLGTCWLGGTFSKSGFARKISADKTEIVPAVAAIGVKMDRRTMRDNLSRGTAGSDRRMPWQDLFFSGDFSTALSPEKAGAYRQVLEMVRRAPSASNKQPWRIVKDGNSDTYHLYLKRTKSYGRTLKILSLADLQRVDMGIAMCHFQLTAAEAGLDGTWTKENPSLSIPDATFSYLATWSGK